MAGRCGWRSGRNSLLEGAPITGFVYDRTDSYSIGILLGFAVTV